LLVENGQLVSRDYADRRHRHDKITAEWQRRADGE
jgi:hypothetical protein